MRRKRNKGEGGASAAEPLEVSNANDEARHEADVTEPELQEGTPAQTDREEAKNAGAAESDEPGEMGEELSLRDHLLALRKVIIICFAAVGIAFLASLYFIIDLLMKWITAPIESRGVQVIYTAVSEALTTKLKVAVVTATVIAFPIIILLYHIQQVRHFLLYNNLLLYF